jgi:hypothetical protein
MRFLYLFLIAIATAGFYSCETPMQKEERLSKQYCGSCHLFPEPGLLDKATWEKSVLPEMAFRMGLNPEHLRTVLSEDIPNVLKTLPASPMVTEEEWKSISNYFIRNAPDSIVLTESTTDPMNQFTVHPVDKFKKGFITAIKFDSIGNKLYVGNRWAKLYTLNPALVIMDSTQLKSAPSHISVEDANTILVSIMGIMDPNDQAKGELLRLESELKNPFLIEDSLQRPVHFEKSDLNKDGLEDFIVCAFGNFRGALLVLEKTPGGSFNKHIINPMPGARKVIVKDFNHDGLNDILTLMTQGDERLILYTNRGDFNFDTKILLRFPPVYGSNYFEIVDFNKDGSFDILLTNGDNADYSSILKPYHAVRVFVNDGEENFTQAWSFAMPGASQASARDFDRDGDLDIAVISFFPDVARHPERGFIYFENNGSNNFTPQTTSLTSSGRWLVMESADLDHDGDFDLLLGAANFIGLGAKTSVKNEQVLLFLENNSVSNK